MTFTELDARLGHRDSVALHDKATKIHREGDDCIAIKYYDKDIVKYYRDNSCEVASGGMRMATMKKRINKYLPDGYSVSQKRFKWMLKSPEGESEFSDYARFDITTRDDRIGKELDKKVYAEARKDNITMEKGMPKKTITLEEAIIRQAHANMMRFNQDLHEADTGAFTGAAAPQDDPANAPTGTFPPPGASPPADAQVDGPKTANTPKPGASDMAGDKSQEIKDEIFDLMKEEGDLPEGMLVKYFEAKGYKAGDVKNALQQLKDEGRIDKDSTWKLSVEHGDEDMQNQQAGVTPGTTEPDTEEPEQPEANAGTAAGPGAEGTQMAAMRNAMPNYKKKDMEEFEGEEEADEDDEDMDTMGDEETLGGDEMEGDEEHLDDEEFEGDEDHLDDLGGDEEFGADEGEPGEEFGTDGIGDDNGVGETGEGSEVEDIEDDIKDAMSLMKSIQSRLNNLKGGNMTRNRARNAGYNDGDLGGDRYGASSRGTDPTGMGAMRGSPAKNPMRTNAMMDDSDWGKYPAWGEKNRGR